MQFETRVDAMTWDEGERVWRLELGSGEMRTARFVVTGLGPLSLPTEPRIEGADDFEGEAFHTFWWPKQPVRLEGRRVGVIGTGATGIQVISEIASQVGELRVFQRRPNWTTPLNNRPISEEEMDQIRSRYDEIFANCNASNSGFEHPPHPHRFWEVSREERIALWDQLYDTPGFAILASNYADIHFDEGANREMSDYVADRIRGRVDDPVVAEKLIPKDHGFGMQRLPLETHYFEAYNRDNVHLVDLTETPIERITPKGIQTTGGHHDLDLIIYATGFDVMTGPYDRVDIRGVDGQKLADKWRDSPSTAFGILMNGFPNLLMVAGPQSVSGSSNFPRAIEGGVDWIIELLQHAEGRGVTRLEARPEAEREWVDEVVRVQESLLIRHGRGWFTGHTTRISGGDERKTRYLAYFGGLANYLQRLRGVAAEGYRCIDQS
jgi:cation diffusion facilitator CzcD-associated flavoprotein CzcO